MRVASSSRAFRLLLIAGVFLTALNMRAPIIAVPPLLDAIRSDTGLSATGAGLLITLPMLCFAVGSLPAPGLARRIGLDHAIVLAMGLVLIGSLARTASPVLTLFAGTVVIGAGIALGNVLVPAVIKRDFPDNPGALMAVYGLGMSIGGTLAAASMVRIMEVTGLGWRGTLGTMAIPVALAVASLLPRLLHDEGSRPVEHDRPRLWRDRLAWNICLIMALQAFAFFGVGSWAPTILTDAGMSQDAAGVMWSIANFGAVPSSFIAPLLFTRGVSQRAIMIATTAMFTIGIGGMLVAPTTATPIWMFLLGSGSAFAFSAVLILVVERSPDVRHAASLGAMTQLVGYGIGATSPFLFGALRDATGSWTPSIVMVLLAMIPFLWVSLGACKPGFVGQRTEAFVPN